MKINKKPEIVAPAGSFEKLKYAFEYGADAVYCGIPDFSLRARINYFDTDEMLEGIRYAHNLGKKVYVTVNIFAHNEHIKKLPKYLEIFKKELPDAFIASDPGVIAMIKEVLPKAKIHLSTQANCTNWRAAKLWYDLGVKRVVLAREVGLKEIKEIRKNIPGLEIESFVHGAMCMAYSGRCFLSAWLSGRSANLGDCTQVCRWKYNLVEEKRDNIHIPLEEDQHGSYILNSKDLCLIDYVKDLRDAGVDSFKIEGRAKSVHYLATVVKSYKSVIDANFSKESIKEAKKELNKNVNREYTTGFLLGKDTPSMQNMENRSVGSDWEFAGEVLEKVENGVVLKVHNMLKVGDKAEIIQPRGDLIKMKVKNIFNKKNGKKADSVHGGTEDLFILETKEDIMPMSLLRRENKNIHC
ncbi:MAG: U32 family peptidase [Parcubacteria group bacterium]|nr:U32 family peptidase [Parcubacteria group bacterium]MCR4343108.1 U32 family peptidase [Patescibacteria group bacterium]